VEQRGASRPTPGVHHSSPPTGSRIVVCVERVCDGIVGLALKQPVPSLFGHRPVHGDWICGPSTPSDGPIGTALHEIEPIDAERLSCPRRRPTSGADVPGAHGPASRRGRVNQRSGGRRSEQTMASKHDNRSGEAWLTGRIKGNTDDRSPGSCRSAQAADARLASARTERGRGEALQC
jgi:hypothetical protein